MGEGSGILILEELEHAQRRGANILAEIVGYGMSGDAYHITSPSEDGDGAFRVMRLAIKDAGIEPEKIDYVNAHGTSTEVGDRIETTALKRVFCDHAYKLAVSSTKSMTGHLLGGAGGLEAGITVLALRDQIAPPTVNLDVPDPECDLDYVPHHARRMKIDYALSNSFGFGGTNGCLIFKRYTSSPPSRDREGAGLPMKILVSIKQVPSRDSQLRIDPSGRWIQENDLSFEINEPDAFALEEALRLKEKHGGEVVALCAGPARASQTIREALAKGADRAIHIEEENLAAFDTLGVAKLLAKAAEAEHPDLILTGLQSDDLGYGQTGVVMAELLGLPHGTIIMAVEKIDSGIRVKRELEDGWFQNVEMPLPAILTIQSGINKLRYATLMGIKKAKTKEVKRLTAAELGVTASPTASIERVYLPAAYQADSVDRRQRQGSRGETGGEAAIRGSHPMSGVLVVMEQRGGTWHRMSWETLAAGQQLAAQTGQKAYAAVIGHAIGALAEELSRKKLDHVHTVEHALLRHLYSRRFTAALEQLIRKHSPSIVLFPHTYQVRDFAPKLATRFNQVLVSDSVGFRIESGAPIFIRQLFQGKLNADVKFNPDAKLGGAEPHFASIQAGAFRADQVEDGTSQIENFAPDLSA